MISPNIMLHLISNIFIQIFDLLAIAMLVFAGLNLVYKFFTCKKMKGSYSLTHKNYHLLRSRFIHRLILAFDLFILADMFKIAITTGTDELLQILLIVIIRTILSYFLNKEIEFHE